MITSWHFFCQEQICSFTYVQTDKHHFQLKDEGREPASNRAIKSPFVSVLITQTLPSQSGQHDNVCTELEKHAFS